MFLISLDKDIHDCFDIEDFTFTLNLNISALVKLFVELFVYDH
jgi:hypothetical protein